MKGKSVFTFVFVLFAAVAIFAAGCSAPGGESGNGETPKEYKIGAVLSVTGKASFLGEPEKKTLEMLEKQLNDAGGINGVPVKIIIEDDGGEETKTINAASKLVDKDEVLAVIGPSRSGNTLAIKSEMTEAEVTLIALAAAEEIVDPVSPWVFKVAPNDSFVAQKLLAYMKETGIKKIAVLFGNTGFGQEGLKHMEKYAPDFGVEIAFKEAYSPAASDADIETLLTKVKSDDTIEAIVNWSILPAQSTVPRKMHQLQMENVKLFHSHGFANIRYVENAGPTAEGIIFPAGRLIVAEALPEDNPQKEAAEKYKTDYETQFGEDVSTFGGHAYDAFWMIVAAIEKHGADRAKIREAIENTKDFAGTGGVFSFTPEDHGGLTVDCVEMTTVENSSFAPLAD